jgi:GNAT superfamily N-acetyltransferase
VLVNPALLGRLEASDTALTVALVEQLRRLPGAGEAEALPFGPGALVAMGAGRYVNRAVGIGREALGPTELSAIEHFYAGHGLPAAIELSSWAPAATVDALGARGCTVSWFRAVLVHPLTADRSAVDRPTSSTRLTIERVTEATADDWRRVLAHGNELAEATAQATSDEFATAAAAVPGSIELLARLDGEAVGCGSIQLAQGIAWLGGAATVPSARNQGVQGALLRARLDLARETGAELAAATAVPSGTSARNLGRAGFTIVQTQAVVVAPTTAEPPASA